MGGLRPMRPWALLGLVAVVWSAVVSADTDEQAARLYQAWQAGVPLPVLSIDDPALDRDSAYRVQRAYVQRRLADDGMAGFKAGLTAKPAQARFGVDYPLAGVLWASGRYAPGARIDARAFRKLVVETEVALVVGERIDARLADVDALKARIERAVPAIELADIGFADPQRLTGPDIVAANVGAAAFIPASAPSLDLGALSATRVCLYRAEEVVSEGRGDAVMGDPWTAALWLVNRVVEQGYAVEPGQALLTGAMGKPVSGTPGRYRADFGLAGVIAFEIVDGVAAR